MTPSFAIPLCPERMAAGQPVAIFLPAAFVRAWTPVVAGKHWQFLSTNRASTIIRPNRLTGTARELSRPGLAGEGVPGFNQSRFLGPRVHACKQFARSIYICLSQSPFVWVAGAAHGSNHDARSIANVRNSLGEFRNVEC